MLSNKYHRLGNAVGPLVGTLLNFGMGFAGPLYVYAGIILVSAIVTSKWIEADEFNHDAGHGGQSGSIAKVMINPKVFFFQQIIISGAYINLINPDDPGGAGVPIGFPR